MENFYEPDFDPDGPPLQEEQQLENVGSTTARSVTIDMPHARSVTIDAPHAESQPAKKCKLVDPTKEWKRRSPFWDHYSFSTVKGKDGKLVRYATCIHCHVAKYKADPKYAYLAANPLPTPEFDQKVFCRMFADAIMYHSYPLSIVEHVKLREMLTYLNSKVRHITRNTILKYCLLEHKRLKSMLHEILADVNSRICFTCDCWSACTSRGFLTLTAHFIDNNWNLKSRILNFRYFPPPHRGVDIYLFVVGLIKEWNLEGKTFSMTCDNAGSMDVMVARLKSDLQTFGTLPLGGRFFHVRCCAHILNLIVQSGMKVIDASVLKVRETVNYIAGSDNRLVLFEKCVVDSKSNFVGKLLIDCATRWNSTYQMLKRALEAKDALNLFAIVDTSFDFGLSADEWNVVDFVCKFLEPFYNITVMFSGSDYPTANLYFRNIVAIEKLLVVAHTHTVASIQSMATVMMEKFEKYWSDYSILLAIAVLLDPRYKMHFVKTALGKLYVHAEVEDFEGGDMSVGGAESSVDSYLNSPLVPRNTESFNILEFWKSQASTFPVISRMAKDVLAVPITSVASESSFSMGGRVLTKYRSALRTDNVEAFVTTQNWLYGYLKDDEVQECFEVMKEVQPDIDFDSLPTEEQ
ncbi:putative AC transposase [Bienertia sinuspersici]